MKLLERAAIVLVSVALAIVLIALLSGYFTARDQPSVTLRHGAPRGGP